MRSLARTWLCLSAALALSTGLIRAHCFELGIAVKQNGALVATPVEVREAATGLLIGNFSSSSIASDCSSNLLVDFDNNCGGPTGAIHLSPNVRYVFTLPQWDRSFDVLGSMPNGLNNYDDYWQVTSAGATPVAPAFCNSANLQQIDNFGTAPPAVSLTIPSTQKIGSKTTFNLRAAASGGNGSFAFSWINAQQTSGAGVNPSLAYRTVWAGNTAVVRVQVTSRGRTANREVILAPTSGP